MSSHSSQFVYHLGRLLQYAADVACSAWFRSCCFCYDVSSLPCFQFCPAVSYEATVLSVLVTMFTVQHRRLELAHCPAVLSSRCQPCPICGVSTYVHTYVKFAPSVLVTWRQSFGFLLCCSVFRGLSWLGVVGVLPPAVWVPSVTGRSCSLVSQLLCSY